MNWNQPQRGGKTAKPVDNALHGRGRHVALAIAALLCIAAFVAAYLTWRGGVFGRNKCDSPANPAVGDGRDPIRAFRGNAPTAARDSRTATTAGAPPLRGDVATKAETAPKEVWLGREIVRTTAVTNGTDLVITRIDSEGKVHKEYTSIRRRLFTNPVDIVLSILLTTPEGAPVPPLPPLGPRADDLFAASLRQPIEVADGDSEQDARLKRLVMAAREEMLEELAAGHSVNDVIEAHCTYAEERNTLRAEATVNYRDILARDGEAAAEEYRARANELLARHGASPIRSVSEIRVSRDSRRKDGGVR